MSDKSEEPTPQRLRKAREQGDSPISQPLTQALAFVVAVALAPAAIAATLARSAELLPRAIENPGAPHAPLALALDVLVLSLPIVAAAALAGGLAGAVQAGGVIAWKKLGPDFGKLNPAQGLKSLVTRERLIGIARALVASLVVGYLAVRLMVTHAADLAATTGALDKGGIVAGHLLEKLAWIAALVGLALAGVDLLVVRQGWLRRNRMSKDEVKREHKESEGDPHAKRERERVRREIAQHDLMESVRSASVVVVNPTHLAVALRFDEDGEQSAPEIVGKGQDELARRMIRVAEEAGVPVMRDVPLARGLFELEVGDEIPERLYEAVAAVLRAAWAEREER